jgi:hypothetical protein
MNEQELRQALRATMTAATAPPPMNETPMLEAARRAERRRRARWAGAGSAVAAAAVVGLAVVAVALTSGTGRDAVGPGGGTPTSATSTGPTGTESSGSGSSGEGTEPEWPDGQTDATARSGPHYETGLSLLESMGDVAPPGYEAPRGMKYADPAYVGTLDSNQAAWDGKVNGVDVWRYTAIQPLQKGNRMGKLTVEVAAPGNEFTGTACELGNLWGYEGTCTERTVDGKRVGLFVGKPASPTADRTAVYRWDDGTVVWVSQSAEYEGAGLAKLTALPYSPERLAELATDEKFRLH